jgi:putative transposase
MDGKGRCRDSVVVESLWRTIKCDEVYLNAYDLVSQARMRLASFIEFYNARRPHLSLNKKTPNEFPWPLYRPPDRQFDP